MRLTSFVALAFTAVTSAHYVPHFAPRQLDYDPCTSTGANASVALGDWLACQVNGFYPYPANGDWLSVYDAAFSPSVLASFNATRFSFDGFRDLYVGVNASIGAGFASFEHGFTSVVGVPSTANGEGDAGGFVYLTGWQGGKTVLGTEVWATDAVFAVVEDVGDGERKIVEFREASNTASSGSPPPSQDWTCALP